MINRKLALTAGMAFGILASNPVGFAQTAKPAPKKAVPKKAVPVKTSPITATPKATPVPEAADTEVRRIAKEDILFISVVDHAELTSQVAVLTDGTIHYQFLGENSELNVVGLTLVELQKKITAALEKQYVRPQVVVSIVSSAPRLVTILGSGVRAPGPKQMRDGWHVLDAIAEVGGLPIPDRPELYRAILFRKNGTESVPIDLTKLFGVETIDQAQNRRLDKGDILVVDELTPDRTSVTMIGEVQRPGPLLLPKDGSFLRAINTAGRIYP